jgi:Tol biopolymer transport system component
MPRPRRNSSSGRHRLTRDAAGDGDPAWSPNGQKLAFTRERGAYTDVYLVDADGSSEKRLTQRGARPLWSPDG